MNDYPRLGSVVGYDTVKSLAAGITKAGATDAAKVVEAFAGLKVDGPFGPFDIPRQRPPGDHGCLCR